MNADNAFFVGLVVFFAIMVIPAFDTVMGWISGGRRRRVSVEREYAPAEHVHPECAPAQHEHAQYVSRTEYDSHRGACAAQSSQIAANFSAGIEKLERQLDHIRNGINERLDSFNQTNEERAARLHNRVDVSEKIVSAVHARVEDHLQDHRAAKGNSNAV